MQRMQAKAYLEQLEKLDNLIENKLAEQMQWKAMALSVTAHTDGVRVQSSGSQQKMADAIDRYLDIEREINDCIDELKEKKQEIIGVIEQLNAIEYNVLHKRYVGRVIELDDETFTVERFTFEEIADLYKKSYSWATTVHGRALQNVQRILDRM